MNEDKKIGKQVSRDIKLIDRLPLIFFLNDVLNRVWGSVVKESCENCYENCCTEVISLIT